MSALLATATVNAPPVSGVPMLDVSRQNVLLRQEIDAAHGRSLPRRARSSTARPARRLEAAVAAYCGTEHAVGCASGSDALLLALMALDIGPGDEVILPSFTFFATAGAVWRLGARPVFADIDPETFNIDPADVVGKITPGHARRSCRCTCSASARAMDAIRQIASAGREAAGDRGCLPGDRRRVARPPGRRAGHMRLPELLSDEEPGRLRRRRHDHDRRRRAGANGCACCAITGSSRGTIITWSASTAGSTRSRRPCWA